MACKAQITIFIIVGIVLLVLLLFFIYLSTSVGDVEQDSIDTAIDASLDATPIKAYFQGCAQNLLQEAVYNMGLQGGYIDPAGNIKYGEVGTIEFGLNGFLVDNADHKVPYYLDEFLESRPRLNDIEEKLEKYLIVEFERCFEQGNFESQGYELRIPSVDYESVEFDFNQLPVDSSVEITDHEVIANILYPITVVLGTRSTRISEFIVSVPVRIPHVYDIADKIITELLANNLEYLINDDCPSFDDEHLTNVYFSQGIIQIVDFKPYNGYLHQSFFYQFAINNTRYGGQCLG